MRRPSLRGLLLGSVLVTLAIGFCAFGFRVDQIHRESRLADLDEELGRASRTTAQGTGAPPPARDLPDRPPEPAEEPSTETANGDAIAAPVQLIVAPDGELLRTIGARAPFAGDVLAGLAGTEGIVTVDGAPRHRVLTTTNTRGQTELTALPLDGVDTAVADLRQGLAVGGGAILATVAAVLWFLTGFLARPVTRMAETAGRIASGQLDTTVGPPSGSRETRELATDLDRMLERLRDALAEATTARAAMERLLADMAHEIRTPLTALRGYSELYRTGMLDSADDVDRAMERIGSESERLHELADGILLLARNSVPSLQEETFGLGSVAGDVVDDLRAAFPGQRIDLHHDGGNDDVNGSPGRMHQALLNLGSNACRFSPPGEPVTVTVRCTPSSVRVEVADHGEGVADDDREQIFLPFVRADSARNRTDAGGAGLGLALSRQIVEQHGGQLDVVATPGGGATFVLAVPTALVQSAIG